MRQRLHFHGAARLYPRHSGAQGRRPPRSPALHRVLLLLLGALVPLQASRADQIDDLLQAAMRTQRIPGMALLVVHAGQVVRVSTYGLSNVELAAPVRHDTLFQSGSLGKQFTAAAVLLLQERGRLSLEDSMGKYLPPGPPAWAPITVRRLLDHTSGIHDSEEDGGEIFDLRREYSDADV